MLEALLSDIAVLLVVPLEALQEVSCLLKHVSLFRVALVGLFVLSTCLVVHRTLEKDTDIEADIWKRALPGLFGGTQRGTKTNGHRNINCSTQKLAILIPMPF